MLIEGVGLFVFIRTNSAQAMGLSFDEQPHIMGIVLCCGSHSMS